MKIFLTYPYNEDLIEEKEAEEAGRDWYKVNFEWGGSMHAINQPENCIHFDRSSAVRQAKINRQARIDEMSKTINRMNSVDLEN